MPDGLEVVHEKTKFKKINRNNNSVKKRIPSNAVSQIELELESFNFMELWTICELSTVWAVF